jgi:glycosyltransferase involved in cell wall biosynthesis
MKRCLQLFPNKKNRSFRLLILKKDAGKAAGVRLGFDNAKGDIIIIYDADMTIPAADLLKFYTALITRKGDFINGSRLVYPVGKGAMQLLNILGNKFFTILYSWLLGQQVKDTLCGTKAFWRKDYLEIKRNVDFLKSQDPFGDFYLLLGASRLNLKIIDLPVRYCERTYGSTNIKRFKHAWQLFKLSLFSIKKFKMRI